MARGWPGRLTASSARNISAVITFMCDQHSVSFANSPSDSHSDDMHMQLLHAHSHMQHLHVLAQARPIMFCIRLVARSPKYRTVSESPQTRHAPRGARMGARSWFQFLELLVREWGKLQGLWAHYSPQFPILICMYRMTKTCPGT